MLTLETAFRLDDVGRDRAVCDPTGGQLRDVFVRYFPVVPYKGLALLFAVGKADQRRENLIFYLQDSEIEFAEDFSSDFALGLAVDQATTTVLDKEGIQVVTDDAVEEERGDGAVDATRRGEGDLLAGFDQAFYPGHRFLDKVRRIEVSGVLGRGVFEPVRLDLIGLV